MAAVNVVENPSEKTFEQLWVIKNWKSVVQSKKIVENTKTEIRCEIDNVEIAKFIVSAKLYSQCRYIGLHWKLLGYNYNHNWIDNIRAELVLKIPKRNRKYECQADAVLEKNMDIFSGLWYFSNANDVSKCINEEGSLEIYLKLTLKKLSNPVCYTETELFRNASQNEFGKSLTALLDDQSNSDLKILTKDETELLAHKAILCARCPVFAEMYESGFPGNNVGRVNVNDVSGKTMKILPHYWYTGELQPSWKDNDTIVEFIQTVEKFQMTEVLKMLDNLLGQDFQTESSAGELLQLLKIVTKLSLKRAETRIVELIVNKARQASGGADLLGLFPFVTDEIEKDENIFDISHVLKAFEDVLSCSNKEVSFTDVKLMALACKLGMKTVEAKLVQRIVGRVTKVGSSEELFALFDLQNDEITKEISSIEPSQEVVYLENS